MARGLLPGLVELFRLEAVLSCLNDAQDNQQMMQLRVDSLCVQSVFKVQYQKAPLSFCGLLYSSRSFNMRHSLNAAPAIRKNHRLFVSAGKIILLHGFLVVKFFDRSLHRCVAFACLRDGVLNLGDANGPLKALIPFPVPLFNQENNVSIQFLAVEM